MSGKISLGKYISARRKQMEMTQEIFADRIGVSKSAVAKWETDGGIPDRNNLKRVAETLGITVDELHRVIENADRPEVDFDINITPDLIAVLEAYGYKVIRPGEAK